MARIILQLYSSNITSQKEVANEAAFSSDGYMKRRSTVIMVNRRNYIDIEILSSLGSRNYSLKVHCQVQLKLNSLGLPWTLELEAIIAMPPPPPPTH